jgi:hypothetical protein
MTAIRVTLIVVCLCSTSFAQLTQKEACQKFYSSVVQINAGGSSYGTGFLISDDGWIFTAAHVVLDETEPTAKIHAAISVTLTDGSAKLATQVLPVEPNMFGRDYALLKVEGTTKFPHLDLGEEADNVIGSDITIIGFPFSAVAFKGNGPSIKDKFCLSGTVAFSGQTVIPVPVTSLKGSATVNNVNVDVIYFQGPSVKGLSGAPIISRDTGHVIAILTSKLTGISGELAEAQKAIATHPNSGIRMGGVELFGTTGKLIEILDQQLANGLGAGTGIDDAKAAFRHALRQRGPTQKQ